MSSPKDPKPEKMADFFNHRADHYDQHMQENVENFEAFYATVAQPILYTKCELHILDIGCGTGLELASIFHRAPNAQITAVDLSEKMLAQLYRKYENYSNQIKRVQGSYLEVDLGTKQYEYVISVMTLHHLLPEKKLHLYKNIHRALKKGGKYIEGDYVVSEKKESQFLAAYWERMKKAEDSQEGVYHIDIPMSKQRQINLLKEAGFADVKISWEKDESVIFVAEV